MDGKKWLGWWIVTTPQGKEYATEYYEGDSYEEALTDAVATFGGGNDSQKRAAVRRYQG